MGSNEVELDRRSRGNSWAVLTGRPGSLLGVEGVDGAAGVEGC